MALAGSLGFKLIEPGSEGFPKAWWEKEGVKWIVSQGTALETGSYDSLVYFEGDSAEVNNQHKRQKLWEVWVINDSIVSGQITNWSISNSHCMLNIC